MTADRDLYDLAEACRRLSISDKYARNLIKAGTLAAVRQGRKICVSHEAISDYLAGLKPVRDQKVSL